MRIILGPKAGQFGIVGTNYCGPGYAGGKFPKSDEKPDFSVKPTENPVDKICKEHDEAYAKAKNSPTPEQGKLDADVKMISDIKELLRSSDSGESKALSADHLMTTCLVLAAFELKVPSYQWPAAIMEEVSDLIKKILDKLGEYALKADVDFSKYIEESCEIDPVCNADYSNSRKAVYDPLVLDLDGDGIETVGIATQIGRASCRERV